MEQEIKNILMRKVYDRHGTFDNIDPCVSEITTDGFVSYDFEDDQTIHCFYYNINQATHAVELKIRKETSNASRTNQVNRIFQSSPVNHKPRGC